MNPRVTLKGVQSVQQNLGALGTRDSNFAMAKTLTRLAQHGQGFIRTHTLIHNFIIRKAGWMKGNIRIKPATKDTLQSEVMDTFGAMTLQETGGTKMALGKVLCIPLRGAKRSPKALIRKEDYPAAVMQQGGFIRGNIMYRVKQKTERRHGGREGPMNRTRVKGQVIPMYWLVPQAKITARYNFEQDVRRVVEMQFEPEFTKIWNEITAQRGA